jgi:hypothetical protein
MSKNDNLAVAIKRRDNALALLVSAKADVVAATRRIAESGGSYLGNRPSSHPSVQTAQRVLWNVEEQYAKAAADLATIQKA